MKIFKVSTHDDPEEDIYQREANILHKREDEHQSAVSKDEIKSKFTHDASEDAVFKLKADTFHERQYAKPSEYGKKDTRSKSQKHDAMEEILYQLEADSDEVHSKKETRSDYQTDDAPEDAVYHWGRGTFHEKEDEIPFDSSIDYEIDYNDYNFENWRINNYRDPFANQTLGGFIPHQMNFAKEASSNVSAVPVGPTPPPPPPPPPNPPT
ncbi:unnamed protein product [Mytilus edulis]|uniref:Uncharacterized protein n=1 Tax=Mytilus edulis TaxID=6550 RepID=A0A8S3RP88_MYTED|nr:unnamed protein product [Mytilus edulis]